MQSVSGRSTCFGGKTNLKYLFDHYFSESRFLCLQIVYQKSFWHVLKVYERMFIGNSTLSQ